MASNVAYTGAQFETNPIGVKRQPLRPRRSTPNPNIGTAADSGRYQAPANATQNQVLMAESGRLNSNGEVYRFTRQAMRPNALGTYSGAAGVNSGSRVLPADTDDAAALSALVQYWIGLQACGAGNPNCEPQRAAAEEFLQLVRTAQWNGQDIQAILRNYQSVNQRRGGSSIRVPSAGSYRIANMSLAPSTKGTRGVRGQRDLPSFLWQVLATNVDNLPALNQAIADNLSKRGIDAFANAPDYSNYQADENATLLRYIQGYRDANGCMASNVNWIARLLNDIDYLNANGADVFSFLRDFTLRFGGPVPDRSKFRIGGGFSPSVLPTSATNVVTPVRGISRSLQHKVSLLWYIAEDYCDNLPAIVTQLETQYNIPKPAGLNTFTNTTPGTYNVPTTRYESSKADRFVAAPSAPIQNPIRFNMRTVNNGQGNYAAQQSFAYGGVAPPPPPPSQSQAPPPARSPARPPTQQPSQRGPAFPLPSQMPPPIQTPIQSVRPGTTAPPASVVFGPTRGPKVGTQAGPSFAGPSRGGAPPLRPNQFPPPIPSRTTAPVQ